MKPLATFFSWSRFASLAVKLLIVVAVVLAGFFVYGQFAERFGWRAKAGPAAPGAPLAGAETPASDKAKDQTFNCASQDGKPGDPAAAPRKLIIKEPRAKDVPELERRSGFDLDRDGLLDGKRWRVPDVDGDANANAPEQLTPPKADFLKEERFDTRGRGNLRVGAYLRESGEVDLVGDPAPKAEWLHLVELEGAMALDQEAAFVPRPDDWRIGARWIPARWGPAYPSLAVSLAHHGELLEQLDRVEEFMPSTPELEELRRDLERDLRIEMRVLVVCRGLPTPKNCRPR